ncbi:hypothetical protein [Actinocrispum wychmicini]|uniref:Uncharacterized protein n=1 Tax=Actinocrispum wychmicini TaxID=1213861 RepID=A0A4R2JRH1_9PSEU|nr:hypothetical protein [Actinocrispum wychmicini]TCO62851.1 hypothetical protein EV192_102990 [Actinocrispum wychmicini]
MAGVGLGAPADIDQLQRRITELEQQVVELHGKVAERDQELDTARTANRELITTSTDEPDRTNRADQAYAEPGMSPPR